MVVGLALQQTLGNLLAGLALAWEQRLTIGTWVEMDGELGLIEQTGWRSLVIRTRLGERVLTPNSDVAAARLTILGSGERLVAVPVRLGVAYRVPPDAAKETLRRVAVDILADGARIRRYAPTEAVVRTGEESTALYLVVSGEAVVEQQGREIAALREGDFFGETAFLSSVPRTADVRAVGGPLEVAEIDAACLRPLLEDHPELADQLAEKMATRQLEGQELRDETGALISPKGLVNQFRRHLLKIIGR